MLTVAQLQVEVGANTAAAESGLQGVNEQVEKSGGLFGSLKGFAGNALSTLMGFVGGQIVMQGLNMVIGQATQMIGDMFDEAGHLTTAEAQLNAVLQSTHDISGVTASQVNALADQMSQMSGVSKSTILDGQNMLLTFTGIGQDVFPEASNALLNFAIAMNGGSTANLNLTNAAIQLGKALNDPLQGLNALKREGVSFSAQEIELIKHFMAIGDTADAQRVMLKELQTEFGNSATAAGSTFGGAIDKVKNILVDFGANAIQKVETWLQPLVVTLAQDLPGALDKAGKFFGQVGGDIGSFFSKLTGGKGLNIGSMFGDLTKGMDFGAIVGDLANFGKTIQSQVLPIAMQLSSWFKADMLPAIESVLPTIQQLGQTFVNDIVPAFIQVEGYGAQVAGTIAKTLLPIFETIEPIVVRLTGFLLDLANKAIKFLTPYVEDAFKAISQFATEMSTRLQPFIEHLTTGIQVAAAIISAAWGVLWPWMSAILKTVWDQIAGLVKTLWDFLTGLFKIGADLLSGNWGQLWKDVQSLFQNLTNDLHSMGMSLWNDLQGIFKAGAKIIGDVWNNVMGGLSAIAKTAWDDVKSVIADGINGAIGLLNGLIDQADKIPGVSIPHIPNVSFASGGIMPYSGLALVGEQGPEVVSLPAGAQVYSNQQSQAMFGRGGNTYILNGPTSDQLWRQFQAHGDQQKALAFGGTR